MAIGAGYGTAFGGAPLVPLSEPVSRVGSSVPVTIDFTDEADGPLPGHWETRVLSDDGSGAKTTELEPTPDLYFRVSDGLAGWYYLRAPALPAPAAPFDERGTIASPSGILVSRNAEVAIVFISATDLESGPAPDEVRLEVLIGLRSDDALTSYVGGRVRAEQVGGVWTVPLAVETISASGADPVVLGSATVPPYNDPLDLWESVHQHELRVRVRGDRIWATLDGVIEVGSAVPNTGRSRPVILVRAFIRRGATIIPLPVVVGVSFQSLRDEEALGPAPQIEGDIDLEAAQIPKMHLPLSDLIEQGIFKRVGARRFVATRAVEVEVPGGRYAFEEGDPVRATEPYDGQLLTSVVLDLAAVRGARRGRS